MFLPAAFGQSTQPAGKRPPLSDEELAQQKQANCLLKVTCDPTVLPLSPQTMEALISSTGVARRAFWDTFEHMRSNMDPSEENNLAVAFELISASGMTAFPPETASPVATPGTEGFFGGGLGGYGGGSGMGGGGTGGGGGRSRGSGGMPGGGSFYGGYGGRSPRVAEAGLVPSVGTGPAGSSNTVIGRLTVDSQNVGGAVEIMAGICSRLQAVLNEAYASNRQQVDEQFKIALDEMDQAEQELIVLQKYRSEWSSKTGQSDLSREALLGQSTRLEQDRQRLEMELAGQQARRDALQQQIADIGKRTAASEPEKDPMVAVLKIKLESLLQKYRLLEEKNKSGLVPSEQVMEVATQVKMAELELAQQIQKATAAAGGDALAKLNEELAGISVDTTQKMVQLKLTRSELDKINRLLSTADDYERNVDIKLPLAKRNYEMAMVQHQGLERMRRALRPPVVTVIGGASTTERAK